MTDRSKASDSFAKAVMERLDGVEPRDRRRWLDRDARRGLLAVGCLTAAVVIAAGLSWMIRAPKPESISSPVMGTQGVQDAFRRLSIDPADLPNSTNDPLENSDGSATSGEADRYDSAVAAGPGHST
ncbi:MAG: hypothetical protein O3A19_06615 [Planctomycetota bacterium]|jgi:hypothetical protein|nr:hypothetical protein [Planctomycetota bacterium]MDA1026085.1 hypothetical protein [Planctomycetota bacterium]